MNFFDEETYNALIEAGIEVEKEVSARTLTTFGSGGFVDYVVYPKSIEEVERFVSLDVKYHVLGAGSNALISDNGLRCVLSMKKLKGFSFEGNKLIASAGEFLPVLAKRACEKGLSGLEFACGIPATVGGAVKMNAGAFGCDISKVCESVSLLKNGEIASYSTRELGMRYRDGRIGSAIVLTATFALKEKDPDSIAAEMRENDEARGRSQPREPSCGSAFKRANGSSPAIYIQGCGLKGVRIGGAAVSGKHCNFIVNMNGAQTRDYLRLVDVIKDKVRERYGVELEEEFVFLRD